MAKDPSYPMYAQDFDMDTADWGIDEVGVYIRLLNYEWINGYIPSNLDRISKIARVSPRKLQKIWEIIEKKFSQNGIHILQNRRMEEEREKRNKYIESQRKSGKKGGMKRWEGHSKPISDPISEPNSENMALRSQSSSSISLKNKKKVKKKKDSIPKDKYLEFVFFTKEQKLKLDEKYGAKVEPMIEMLNNYIGQSGKKYKSHYHVMLGWVAEKIENEKQVPKGASSSLPYHEINTGD